VFSVNARRPCILRLVLQLDVLAISVKDYIQTCEHNVDFTTFYNGFWEYCSQNIVELRFKIIEIQQIEGNSTRLTLSALLVAQK